jgi:hypothetical protein
MWAKFSKGVDFLGYDARVEWNNAENVCFKSRKVWHRNVVLTPVVSNSKLRLMTQLRCIHLLL